MPTTWEVNKIFTEDWIGFLQDTLNEDMVAKHLSRIGSIPDKDAILLWEFSEQLLDSGEILKESIPHYFKDIWVFKQESEEGIETISSIDLIKSIGVNPGGDSYIDYQFQDNSLYIFYSEAQGQFCKNIIFNAKKEKKHQISFEATGLWDGIYYLSKYDCYFGLSNSNVYGYDSIDLIIIDGQKNLYDFKLAGYSGNLKTYEKTYSTDLSKPVITDLIKCCPLKQKLNNSFIRIQLPHHQGDTPTVIAHKEGNLYISCYIPTEYFNILKINKNEENVFLVNLEVMDSLIKSNKLDEFKNRITVYQ